MGNRVWWSLLLITMVFVGGAGVARAQTNIALSSFENFTLQYSDLSTGTTLQLTDGDAYTRFYARSGPYLVSVWLLRIPGVPAPTNEVIVGLFNDPITLKYFAGTLHPGGNPVGKRLDFIRQEFYIKVPGNKPLSDYRFFLPKVYGPTFYPGDSQQSVLESYPTFVQAQFVGIEDVVNGGVLCFTTNDDNGLRKSLGFVAGSSTNDLRFVVHYIPEQGEGNPLPMLWLPPYEIEFGYQLADFGAAVNWYRANQQSRTTSFLSQRIAAGVHPDIDNAKFVVAVGATTSSIQLSTGQYDVSTEYRDDVLTYFGGLHGPGMQVYHLGWYRDPPNQSLVIPEGFGTITPGHFSFIQASTSSLARSVCYTLPGIIHPNSTAFNPNIIRLDKDGSLSSLLVPDWPGQIYYNATYYPQTTTSLYANTYVNQILPPGRFRGAYLDALTPQPLSYTYTRDGHVAGENEQLVGIRRMIAAIRSGVQNRRGFNPALFNETPHDCLPTDASAIDLNNFDGAYWNIFRMLHSGREWPVYSVVYGWDDVASRPSGAEFARELANCLAAGARPIVLWPEMLGIFPTDPRNDSEFDPLRGLLGDYIRNYQRFWKGIIDGRRLQPLDPNAIVGPYVNPNPFQPLRRGDPATSAWRLPGRKPNERGGSEYSRMRGQRSRAFFTGVFEPHGAPGRRVIVITRWTDPAMARRAGLPSSDPLHRAQVDAGFDLSAKALQTRGEAVMTLLDVATGERTPLGKLCQDREMCVHVRVPFTSYGTKAIIIE